MSNDSKALAIIPRTVDEVSNLSDRFSKSSLVPEALRNKTADVFVTILAGQELGLSPMASLRGVHVVKGRPILAADTMVALVLGSGKAEYFRAVEVSDERVTYETRRVGNPEPQSATWTIADATRAGLMSNDNWRKYPRAMLKARCRAELSRDVYPDVLAGCYEESEADEIRDRAPITATVTSAPLPTDDHGVIDVELEEPSSEVYDALVAIRETENLDDLRKLAKGLTSLAGASDNDKAKIKAAYAGRKEELARATAAVVAEVAA